MTRVRKPKAKWLYLLLREQDTDFQRWVRPTFDHRIWKCCRMLTRHDVEPNSELPISSAPTNNYAPVRNEVGQIKQYIVPLTRDAKRKDHESERHCCVYPIRIKAAKLGIGIDEWNSGPHDDRSDQ